MSCRMVFLNIAIEAYWTFIKCNFLFSAGLSKVKLSNFKCTFVLITSIYILVDNLNDVPLKENFDECNSLPESIQNDVLHA